MTGHNSPVEDAAILVVGGLLSALGSAIADGLRGRGARVLVSGRSTHGAADAVTLDVTDPASVRAALDGAAGRLGRLDAVVNASGITSRTPALETDLRDWESVLATNLTGSFLVAQAAARIMVQQEVRDGGRGSIVLVGSLCALAGCDDVAAYSASKAGILGLSRALASELGPHGVRVNTLVPGVFPTPLNRDRLIGTPRGDNAVVRTSLGRFGEPSELVGAAAFLAGHDSAFVTGTELVVDGGFLAAGLHSRTLTQGEEARDAD